MRNKLEKFILLIFCIYSLFFFIGSTLAPAMAHFHQYNLSGKLTALYMYSCHQQPDRSFWFLGYPIALCCRCYGFYLGVAISTLIAILSKLNIHFKVGLFLLIISSIDVILNYIFKINTGNIPRFIIGIVMGFLFTVILCYIMKFIKEKIAYVH